MSSVPAPPPPPGPGVKPPFPAPPVEGRSARLWLRIGIASLALVLCCGGVGGATVGVLLLGTRAINEQAKVAVTGYLENLRTGRYADAYAQQCERMRREETAAQFANRVGDDPKIDKYAVGNVDLKGGIIMPVDLTYRGGRQDRVRFILAQNQSTGALQVCGVAG